MAVDRVLKNTFPNISYLEMIKECWDVHIFKMKNGGSAPC
jgi:hypothetical protein